MAPVSVFCDVAELDELVLAYTTALDTLMFLSRMRRKCLQESPLTENPCRLSLTTGSCSRVKLLLPWDSFRAGPYQHTFPSEVQQPNHHISKHSPDQIRYMVSELPEHKDRLMCLTDQILSLVLGLVHTPVELYQ